VGDDEATVVEHVVADETRSMNWRARARNSGRGSSWARVSARPWGLTLRPRRCAHELGLVVAGDAEGEAAGDHVHDEVQDAGDLGAAVDEVADEDGRAALGMVR
jgi:hypothetical protein